MTEIEALKILNSTVTDKKKDKPLRIILTMAWKHWEYKQAINYINK